MDSTMDNKRCQPTQFLFSQTDMFILNIFFKMSKRSSLKEEKPEPESTLKITAGAGVAGADSRLPCSDSLIKTWVDISDKLMDWF